MNSFVAARTLTEYPRGGHRWRLLILTVLASILGAYDFQLAPLLPILLPYLHMSHTAYGAFITFTVLISAISAFFGGPLADRYGRVLIIDICLGFVTALLFLNVLITNVATFVILRLLMGVVAGLTAGAGAALIRDMSPRLSRALAFGLLTIGPVGANFLSNYVAGATLPIYHTWQSQIWIMGFIAVAMYVPIVIWLCDLSPALRMQIMKTEIQALAAEGRLPAASELPSSTGDAFRRLLGHMEVWLLVVGITANLTLYFAIQGFGPLMFTEAFHYSPAEAAKMNEYFWLANLAALVLTGLVSDRLQTRKPIAIFGGILASLLMAWWIPRFGVELPRATMAMVASLMGCFLAIAYVPWAAQFSETLEDVSPALQATGWAFFGLVARGWVAISAPLSLYVAVHYGWGQWVKVALVGMVIYIVAMAFSRGHAAVEEHAHAARTPDRVTAG
ncbi:MAG TPA: MFS transporter [Candidatus Sulfotelmatobacter sp.]|jgi:predicted MFS family arabinose efflux permease|nr:MFS transporter [Candidatus Sulfotelmatobacter sp.]